MERPDAERSPASADASASTASSEPAAAGVYTWRTFLAEHGYEAAAADLYEEIPMVPTVPADAVKRRVDAVDGPVVRAAGVDDPFLADGETAVAGHGTPEAGALVVGDRDVVVGWSAVDGAETGETTADGASRELFGESGLAVVDGADVDPAPVGPPTAADWDRVSLDPAAVLGFDPETIETRLRAGDAAADALWSRCRDRHDRDGVPVAKGYYTWEHYADEFGRDDQDASSADAETEPPGLSHEAKTAALGFDPDRLEEALGAGGEAAAALDNLVDERTVDVDPAVDEDAFFSLSDGSTTLANRYDLEKAVPLPKKTHFTEVERYWVNEPYAFVVVFRSTKENERKYYAVQPHMTSIETDLSEFLTGKLRTSIKYADESIAGGDEAFREEVIAEETRSLLDRYDLYEEPDGDGTLATVLTRVGLDPTRGVAGRLARAFGYEPSGESSSAPSAIPARPEPAVLAEDAETLSAYQVEKLLYYLKRDFIGYERIDPIKHDINVEDISCDGYDSPVFVYHSEYEQIITNIDHGTDELDDFVVKLAQRSGKGISKRRPQVDATLPDGSRAQLTLGREVSDHGTNYTIRQFNDIPFTPIDLINWKTFSLDQMAFLWLCIENNKNLIFAGGTASGKTTSLNAVSLFIPSNGKIVSIEDTREVELPQRNWIASVTRPSFSDDDKGDVDEFDLLEAALRQRPDYIVMGEIRGEEGRTAFQVMSTGHTTYTTFHADSVGEVLKRFTTDPINVSKTMFTALDLVSIQTSTRVQGKKVRRNKSITEINHYDAENDEINVQDVFQWQAETDEFLRMGDSSVLEEIMFDRGWSRERLDDELRKRRVVLAYLIDRGLNSYAQVAATFQAFINDPETVLALMANDGLERSLEDLREMESVLIDVDREKEALVPRPDPDEAGREEAAAILDEAADLFATYRGSVPDSVAGALLEVDAARDVEASPADDHDTLDTISEVAAEREAAFVGPTRPDDEDPGDDEGPDDRGSATEAGADLPADNGTTAPPATGVSDGDSPAGPAENDASNGIDFDDAFDDGVDVGRSRADGAGDTGGNADATEANGTADADADLRRTNGTVGPVERGTDTADPTDSSDSSDKADPHDATDSSDETDATDDNVGPSEEEA